MTPVELRWADAWATPHDVPQYVRSVKAAKWDDFEASVRRAEPSVVRTMVDSIIAGDAWILKGAFTPDYMREMRERCVTWCRTRHESFHQILDGVPDFHRNVNFEASKKYSIRHCRQSAYFFPWNDDPLGILEEIMKRWRVIKIALGMGEHCFEGNIPSTGMTDRVQIARYLPKIGYIEPHRDAYQAQPCFISGYMSTRGKDYTGGGYYFVDKDCKAMIVEDAIEAGDMCIGHANLLHGVAPCDGEPDWNATDGRWFLGLYSVPSDYQRERDTTKPEPIKVEGVIPEGAND